MYFSFVVVTIILLLLYFMVTYFILFGDLVVVGLFLVSSINLFFCLKLLIKFTVKRKNLESVKTTIKIVLTLLEIVSNIFLLGGLIINEESLIFMFVYTKFNIYPFIFYSYFANTIDFYYTIFGFKSILNYCTLSKILGILGFFMLPINYYSLLNFSMLSLLLLFFSRGKDIQDFFVRLLLLDSLLTLTLLVGGINLFIVLFYCFISYMLQVKTFKSLEGNISFLGFYSFLILAGGPLHPLIFFKYLAIFNLSPLYLIYGIFITIVYIQYFILFLFYVRKFFIKDKIFGLYIVMVLGFIILWGFLVLTVGFYLLEILNIQSFMNIRRDIFIIYY